MDENEQLQTFAFPGRSSEGFRVKTLYDTGERLGILINPVKSQNIPTSFSVQAVFPLCCVFGSDAAALDEKAIPQDKSSCLLTVCLASLRTPERSTRYRLIIIDACENYSRPICQYFALNNILNNP